jgi:hypothetical protein
MTYTSGLCDGSLSLTVSTRTCTIANTLFTEEPFGLAWGLPIYAKIDVTNIKGTSVVSLEATGASI